MSNNSKDKLRSIVIKIKLDRECKAVARVQSSLCFAGQG